MTTGRINQVASLERPRRLNRARCECASAPGRGIDGRAKVGRSDFVLRIQPSPSGLPHSHGSMNTRCVRRSEHTGVRLSGGEINAGRPIAPARTRDDTGPADGFQRDYTSKASCPPGEKKHTSTRGMPATQQGRGSTTRACPTSTTRAAAPSNPTPDAPPVHGEPTKRHRRRRDVQIKIGERGTERSRREA
ncbi:hypothetical protein H6P81_021332 [Aristolochia fimbriata]|uniref:Uncharacterized protein n=1 Tax=Aristolochia fimbriata TaxID=158543 RepID=A0AAV7DTE5_ARIFI|nr:hypothetical protein H6P81_021332 [Aristolochia fimbriata]